MSDEPIFLQDEIKKWIPKWWRRFADDKNRGKDNVFCLPCNLEKEGNPNSGRLDFTIPQKSAILVSVVNSIAYKRDNEKTRDLQQEAKKLIDDVEDKQVVLDGLDMTDKALRVQTGVFDLDYDNIAASDGHWLFLKPNTLAKGTHILKRNSCDCNKVLASTYYNLEII